ncbi:MAG: DUF4139 domain-containing protein [Bacteroidales bacterium]|nr:DUF4139 domain-containing protein [Bacteroidales bacterium]
MKKKIIVMLCLLNLIFITERVSAQSELTANTKIDKITVFLNNAQIERTATLNLPSGNSEIRLSGISRYIDANSLRVTGKGNFVIMSQQVQIKYPEPVDNSVVEIPNHILRSISLLRDSLELLAFDIQEVTSKKEVMVVEKNLLQSSTAITKTDTITALRDALAYYRTRMVEINQEWIRLAKTERLLLKKKAAIEERLTNLQNYSQSNTPPETEASPEAEISIVVMADRAVTGAQIGISYLASNVSWQPFYELKVEDVVRPVNLVMRAKLIQNTGENWENAKLVFSTGQPAVYKTIPVLPAWYLSYYQPQRIANQSYAGMPVAVSQSRTEAAKDEEDMEYDNAFAISDYTEVSQGLIAAEYAVSIPYNIPSDGRETIILLLNETLEASYKYLSIPKTDKDVFLTAYLTGWEKLNLVQGQTNIVYQNNIISRTYINTALAMDTLVVSLGVDSRVIAERVKISDKSRDRVIGSTRERTVHFEITLKNQNLTEIQVSLKDQVPVTNFEDIKIIVEEISGAQYNELTGELEWVLTLRPNETKKINFRYTLKYDKNKTILSE